MGRPKVAERSAALVGSDEALLFGLQALADPVRLRMVRLLSEREQCVCHLTETFGLSQASISHHIAVLKRAGLVEDRRDTRWTYYRLALKATSSLCCSIDELLEASQADATSADCCGAVERQLEDLPTIVRVSVTEAQVTEVACSEATTSREA